MEFDSDSAGSIESFFSRLQSSESSPRNLSQIFEDDLLPMQNESRNLRYQPSGHRTQKSSSSSSSTSTTSVEASSERSSVAVERKANRWVVVFAKIVHIYKGHQSMERMGLALTMLGDNEAANMILYKQKSQTRSNTTLKPNGKTIHLQDNYVQFYDDRREYWSVRFVYQADEEEFINVMSRYDWQLEQHASRSEAELEKEKQQDTEELTDQSSEQRSDRSMEQQSERNMKLRSERILELLRENVADHEETRRHTCDNHKHSRGNGDTQEQLRESCDNHKHSREHHESPPQPMPRSRNLTASQEEPTERSSYMDCLRRHFMNLGCEHTRTVREEIPEEDVIVTPMSRPIGSTTTTSNSSMENHCSSSGAVVKLQERPAESSSSRLAKFVDKHMDPGDVADMKMQRILDAMERVSDDRRKSIHEDRSEGTPKPQPRAMSSTEDAEDRLLQLEQLLLDAKKEQRDLKKAIRQRDEDLLSFQSTSLTLMEKMLASNEELSERNNRLLDAIMADKRTSGEKCTNCERSAQEIVFLKRHISALELALRESE
ncbi:hypothetical protein KR054_006690 [Drosophila jambulina]|nr:hypothetical protein KR054_006690 [Drosophila jambulina]